jgi:hypothetical protein
MMEKWEKTVVGLTVLVLLIAIIAVKVNVTKFNIEVNESEWWMNILYGGMIYSVISWTIYGVIAIIAYKKRHQILDSIKKIKP